MERLRIGIPGWSMGDNSFGVGKSYLAHVSAYGDPVILPPMRGILKGIDLIVMPGGSDISSHMYGGVPGFFNSAPDPFKEYFMKQNLDQYIRAKVPIWGTCLGLQQLIVHFGGFLEQDIDLATHGHSGDHRDAIAHAIYLSDEYKPIEKRLLKDQQERKNFKKEEMTKVLWVNSLHHQAAPLKGVPDCFDVIAYSADDYAEAIKHKELPIMAAQFHVEEDYNELGVYLFEQFINLATHDKSNKKSERDNSRTLAD